MKTPKIPAVPDNDRLYAIGDIHGCTDLLRQMTKTIIEDMENHPAEKHYLVFLGDYVDRGVDSKGTIDFLLNELPKNTTNVFLRGNHDDALLRFLKGDFSSTSFWLPCGGTATIASYGINPFQPGATKDLETLRKKLVEKIPADHLDFLKKTQFYFSLGDYYFAHAGVMPGASLDDQDEQDLMWVRGEFLNSRHDHGKIIVHGHSPSTAPDAQLNRIGIDTGAFASGKLTCLVLQGKKRGFLFT